MKNFILRNSLASIYILFSSLNAFSNDSCSIESDFPFSELDYLVSPGLEAEKVNFKKMNISKFCDDTQKSGRSIIADDLRKELNRTDINSIKEYKDRIGGESPWLTATYPDLKIREAGFYKELNAKYKIISLDEIIRVLESPNPFQDTYSNGTPLPAETQVTDKMNEFEKSAIQQQSDFNKSLASKSAICAYYGILNISACIKALDAIIEKASPRSDVVLIDLQKKYIKDTKYLQPAMDAAKKIVNKLKNNDDNCGTTRSDLFTDIYESYIKAGYNKKDAEDITWDLIAMVSTNGGDTASYFYEMNFLTSKTSKWALFASVISFGSVILDNRALKCKGSYSYPKTLKTTCNYGKSYHFWISAYLARYAHKMFGNVQAAKSAAWLTEIGYQMLSTTALRDPTRAFTTPTFSDANNKLRLDLAFAAAGVNFGVQSASSTKIYDVDNAIKALLLDAKPLPPITKEKAEKLWSGTGFEGWTRWRELFSPDSALDFFD